MVFTNAQTDEFFLNVMLLSARTRQGLVEEGIIDVEDLKEFKDKDWTTVASNLKKPPQILDAAGNLVNQPAFQLSARSFKRLKIASNAMRYFANVGRNLTIAMVRWPVLEDFEVQWDSLITSRDSTSKPEIFKMTKGLTFQKWAESFGLWLGTRFGEKDIPLPYVIRPVAAVPALVDLAANKPHAAEYGSIEAEMIARASHDDSMYKKDNAVVYDRIEEALRGTGYVTSLAPYRKSKDGRGAWMALMGQYAGKAMWDKLQKEQESILHTRRWTGTNPTTLKQHCDIHRKAFVQLEQASEHVQIQLPSARTRVTYLLDSLDTKDPDVLAALAHIRALSGGMREDFEATVAYLLPQCPVSKKRKSGTKRDHAEISGVNIPMKKGRGKTGVDLRWHAPEEYKSLSNAQKAELGKWRKENNIKPPNKEGKGQGNDSRPTSRKKRKAQLKRDNKRIKGIVSSLLKEQVKTQNQIPDDSSSKDGPSDMNAIVAQLISSLKSASSGEGRESKKRSVSSLETSESVPSQNKIVKISDPAKDDGELASKLTSILKRGGFAAR